MLTIFPMDNISFIGFPMIQLSSRLKLGFMRNFQKWWMTILLGGEIHKWEGTVLLLGGGIRQCNVGLTYMKNVELRYGCSVPVAE